MVVRTAVLLLCLLLSTVHGLPAIDVISGCNDTETATSSCPTTEDIQVTVNGSDLNAIEIVLVGSLRCENITESGDGNSIVCDLPSGGYGNTHKQ